MVTSLSLENDGVVTPIFSGAGVTPPVAAPGGVTAVVSPLNLCHTGETPASGRCYATPNRVAVTLTYASAEGEDFDFRSPRVPLATRVNSPSSTATSPRQTARS